MRRIFDCLREPVEIRVGSGGTRAVQVLGQAVFGFDADGRIEVALWKADYGVEPVLEPVQAQSISIDPVPYRDVWLGRIVDALSVELGRRHAIRGSELQQVELLAYANWMQGIYRNQVRRHCDLRLVRTRISTALGLNAQVLAIARRMRRRPLEERRLIDAIRVGEWSVQAIADLAGLREEGRAMRHCAEAFAEECQRGEACIFSIRDAESGKRIATLGLWQIGGRWEALLQSGIANKRTPRQVDGVTAAVLQRVHGWGIEQAVCSSCEP